MKRYLIAAWVFQMSGVALGGTVTITDAGAKNLGRVNTK